MPVRTSSRRNGARTGRRAAREYNAVFIKRPKWWVGWTNDVPGALTQGKTLAEAKENLRDAIRLMLEPIDADAVESGATIVRERIRL